MMEFPKTPTGDILEAMIAETRVKMNENPELVEVLEDLISFTGLTEGEVLLRIAKKPRGVWGAKGWFYEEWDFHAPVSPTEIEWFYRSAQSYLFSNARHPSWDQLHMVTEGPVLDFGGGAAMNTLALMRRGFKVMYYDLGIAQTEFAKFRIERHFDNSINGGILLPNYERRAAILEGVRTWHLKGETMGTVVAQDVLEHLPDYRPVLRDLIRVLKPGGCLLERSPFRPKGHKRGIPMHMEAPKPLRKVMENHGMTLERTGPHNTHLWRKAGE